MINVTIEKEKVHDVAKTKTLVDWCNTNEHSDILTELDTSNNTYILNHEKYNSPFIATWKCEQGHRYQCEIVGRTLFGLMCPICHPEKTILPIGTEYGCMTIIDNLQGNNAYKCRCKCGKIHTMSRNEFLQSKRRYCPHSLAGKITLSNWDNFSDSDREFAFSTMCGREVEHLKKIRKTYKRFPAENYEKDFSGRTFESYLIESPTGNEPETKSGWRNYRKRGGISYIVHKEYKCVCKLCGNTHNYNCDQFVVNPPTRYGSHAYNGYWSEVHCTCHPISSFQWKANKLLFENNIPYDVEYTFNDLFGIGHTNLLRFDFVVYNPDKTIKCLIELQGQQHYDKPYRECIGFTEDRQPIYKESNLNTQKANDALKAQYAVGHGITLHAIHYKYSDYEKLKKYFIENDII